MLKGNPVTQKNTEPEHLVPRHGTIYDRLDKARAQRMKSLSPQVAANDTIGATSRSAPRSVQSKSHLLPTIKPQEAFELPIKTGVPGVAKVGIGVLAVSILAGVALLSWGADTPQTTVTRPAEISTTPTTTQLPNADDTARVAGALRVQEATAETLPVIPEALPGAMMIEVQQDADALTTPGPAPESAKDP